MKILDLFGNAPADRFQVDHNLRNSRFDVMAFSEAGLMIDRIKCERKFNDREDRSSLQTTRRQRRGGRSSS